jgi:serine phosphatase RsbU (regulator of sigma subunit)
MVGGRRRRNREPVQETKKDEAVQKAFRLITAEYTNRFGKPETMGDNEFRWSAVTSDPRLRWQVLVRTDGETVREATIRPDYDESIRKEFSRSLTGMGDPRRVVGATLTFFCITLLGGMMIFAWMRKQIDRKAAYTAGLLVLLPAILLVPYSTIGLGKTINISVAVMVPMMALLMASMIGVGQRAAREQEWSYWTGARLFLHRQWRARLIGEELAHGFLWAGWIAAIPALIAVSGLFPGTYLGTIETMNSRVLRTPALNVIFQILEMFSVAFFATLLPLVSQRFPTRILSLAVFWPLATAGLYLLLPFISGPEATIVSAALMSLGGIVLYLNHGLLAVLGLGKAMWMLWAASAAYTSSSGSPSLAFWALLVAYAAMWAGAIVLSKKGTNALPEDPVAAQFLSQRERLKAEFSLAQQAQQRMIPEEPPALNGFSVAASCQPARDVGGDLYDYFSMPGGLTGFCVADVSGKGMSAALYMTLTKGLIAAASPESNNVVELASKINRHLHVACKRKVFVTAILATLEQESRRVDIVRAGHNPALLYEAASRKARYLNPAGIGMGLAGPNLFDRGTKVGTITLAAGDSLILYSDGVTEAMNEELAQFGEERLQKALERCAGGTAPYILSEIKKDLASFTGAEPAHDDVTLLVLQAQ